MLCKKPVAWAGPFLSIPITTSFWSLEASLKPGWSSRKVARSGWVILGSHGTATTKKSYFCYWQHASLCPPINLHTAQNSETFENDCFTRLRIQNLSFKRRRVWNFLMRLSNRRFFLNAPPLMHIWGFVFPSVRPSILTREGDCSSRGRFLQNWFCVKRWHTWGWGGDAAQQ